MKFIQKENETELILTRQELLEAYFNKSNPDSYWNDKGVRVSLAESSRPFEDTHYTMFYKKSRILRPEKDIGKEGIFITLWKNLSYLWDAYSDFDNFIYNITVTGYNHPHGLYAIDKLTIVMPNGSKVTKTAKIYG
ncbi:hypothetical protein CAI16_05495 [Virgibacillus dokdonensis]|uniref:Uncharacterized protein n=1 Tax=Virgibacillus dokdonensis TaxID=302167 RepID=A0A3E0WVN0_9BACI|nr:hypothetical protein [Virgibacillus dokdonensis]RFA36243.1 hypothetical protein CAI16_05495 [Virgibacillus dokdonensis]